MTHKITPLLLVGLLLAFAMPVQADGDECPNCDPEPEDPKEEFRKIGDKLCRVVYIHGANGIDPFILNPLLNIVEFDPDRCYIVEAQGLFFKTTFVYYGS